MLLSVENLKVLFGGDGKKPVLRAVDGVSLGVAKGASIGLVGESGCGKSSIANAVVGLVQPSDGTIKYNDVDILRFDRSALKRYRQKVQMIFQDPFGSLNARLTVGDCLSEVCMVHAPDMGQRDIVKRVSELIEMVGLDSTYLGRYPHEFSGGQRQRIGIARAIAVNPELIVADEPVSALDVSVQVQILNLMKDLQQRMNLSYLFIAHDLAVVRYMCEFIYVMYLGRIVEAAPSAELFAKASHPYTEALLSAVPDVDKGLREREAGSERIVLHGDVPSPIDDIHGCPVHPRCHRAESICAKEVPPRRDVGDSHFSVCHFAERLVFSEEA